MPVQERAMSDGEDSEKVSFIKEIQLMMYGLGDSAQPLHQTAELLEKIILKQLLAIVAQARTVASMRKRDSIQPEDILFLMRKNTIGLKRLITYLGLKDEKQSLNKVMSDNDRLGEDLMADTVPGVISWKVSRRNYCLDHLRSAGIDETCLTSLDDPVKRDRLARADGISKKLSTNAYKSYQTARQASFGAAQVNPKKFVEWLKEGGLSMVVLPSVTEILVYLAKETLSQVIDMVLTLRQQNPHKYMGEAPAISVREVREVVRRCWTPQTFTLGILSRDLPQYADSKLLSI